MGTICTGVQGPKGPRLKIPVLLLSKILRSLLLGPSLLLKMGGQKKNVPFDTVYDVAGHFGLYQLVLFIVFSINSFTGNEITFLNFVGYTPDHWCRVKELEKYGFETQKNVSLPIKEYNSNGKPMYELCSLYGLNYSVYTDEDILHWDRNVHIPNDTKIIACPDGWVYDKSVIQQSVTTKVSDLTF